MAGGKLVTGDAAGADINHAIGVSEAEMRPSRGEGVRLLKNISLSAAVPKRVPHHLGRLPETWMVLRPRVPAASIGNLAVVERSVDRSFVTLESVADVTFDLLVW